MNNVTASRGSLASSQSPEFLGNSHFLPSSSLFRPEEAQLILISDIGIGLALLGLLYASQQVGWQMMTCLYFYPYLWVSHWIVAITYLHHTHPKVPKFEDEAWSFLKGATATVDRDFGWVGKYLLHNVIEYHVVHHLFPYVLSAANCWKGFQLIPSQDVFPSITEKKRPTQSFRFWANTTTPTKADRSCPLFGNRLPNASGSKPKMKMSCLRNASCGTKGDHHRLLPSR